MILAQGAGYKIKGQLPKTMNSEVFLVVEGKNGPIAAGNSIVKDGVFELNGQVPDATSVTIAYLVPKERNAVWATLFLHENAEYLVSTDASGGITVSSDSKYQEIYGEFEAINTVLAKVKLQCELKAKSTSDPKQLEVLQTMLDNAISNAQQKETELIKRHSDSFISAYVISSSMLGADATTLKERYDLLGSKAQSSFYGKKIVAHLSKLENLAIGATAPDFSAPLADGGTVKLNEVNAKVKIVYFWSSWSAPSREENVNLVKLYKQYRPNGLEIIAVSLDENKQTWLTAIGEDGSSWKNIIDVTKDGKPEIASSYCVSSIPTIYVLDQKDKIVAKNIREKELKAKVEEMLRKK